MAAEIAFSKTAASLRTISRERLSLAEPKMTVWSRCFIIFMSAMFAQVVVFPYWRRAMKPRRRYCSTSWKSRRWPERIWMTGDGWDIWDDWDDWDMAARPFTCRFPRGRRT
ncbi:MAG: hypothetical protein IJI36_02740 [Kiritimatiellae bacterium]|nr:hypothetical protein [Kiritimatiellia bacterium]